MDMALEKENQIIQMENKKKEKEKEIEEQKNEE